MQITQRNEITHFLCTTSYIQVVVLLVTYILYHFFPPVHLRESIIVRAIISGSIRIFPCSNGRFGNQCPPVGIIRLGSVILFHGSHIIRPFGSGRRLLEAKVGSERNLRFLFQSPLGGKQDNAVCTFHTVNRSGRSIFQYRDGFYFIHIDIIEITLDAVHQHKRRSFSPSGLTANQQRGLIGSRLRSGVDGNHTGHLTLQGFGHRVHATYL